MPVLDHDGRKVSYDDTGNGPTIVLLPPGASPASAWRKVTECLGLDYRVIAVNPAGYGDTEPFGPDKRSGLEEEAAAVLAILSGIRGQVHLVGHSYGGAIALDLALTAPERFATLTLIEPAPYSMLAQAGEQALADEVDGVNRAFIRDVRAGNTVTALKTYMDYYNGRPGVWDGLSERVQANLLAAADNIVAGLRASHNSPTKLSDYATISIPTLVAAGEETDRVHARLSRVIAGAIPDAWFETVAGAGHMLSLTHPAETARIILKQLQRVDPPS